MDSSTRAWIVSVFGCFGGALMIAICPFLSSLAVLYYGLSYSSVATPHSRGQNTSCESQQHEAGVTPEARRDRGRDFAARWGRSRLSSCFGRVLVQPVLLVHLVVSSAAYVSARVTLGVKSPAKGRLLTLFQGDFTKLFGCRSKKATWPFTGVKTNATV